MTARQRTLSGFGGVAPKAQREQELAVAGLEIDLAGQGDITVLGAAVLPSHEPVLHQVLPAVRDADEAGGAFAPRRR